MEGQIKWKKGDFIRLGQAVSQFNKTKNEVLRLNRSIEKYLPDTQDYKVLKSQIKTRNELNRIIKSLRSFNLENATIIQLEGRSENYIMGI